MPSWLMGASAFFSASDGPLTNRDWIGDDGGDAIVDGRHCGNAIGALRGSSRARSGLRAHTGRTRHGDKLSFGCNRRKQHRQAIGSYPLFTLAASGKQPRNPYAHPLPWILNAGTGKGTKREIAVSYH